MSRIHLHFSFLVFTALVFMLRSGELIFGFFTVCAIHEAGHIAAASLCGRKITSVDITGFGIRMETDRRHLSSINDDLYILLAGPAVNLAAFLLLSTGGCAGSFPLLNLAAALYNLLPYRQLDGGAVIALFTEGSVSEHTTVRLLTALKASISVILLIITLRSGFGTAPLFLASVILLINDIK